MRYGCIEEAILRLCRSRFQYLLHGYSDEKHNDAEAVSAHGVRRRFENDIDEYEDE